MRFHKDAQVLTADGTMVGVIDRLIVDPDQTDITHVVVREGALLEEDRLVPVDEVERTAADDAVILRSGADPREFDAFIEDHYRQTTVQRPMFGPPGVALYPLPDAPGDFIGYDADRPAPTASPGGAPEGSKSIEVGAPVITSDGQRLGKVIEVVAAHDGEIDGLIAQSGYLFWKRHWLIPAPWVRRINDDGIFLMASEDEVRHQAGKNPAWMSGSQRGSTR